jgi:hypothetical protein
VEQVWQQLALGRVAGRPEQDDDVVIWAGYRSLDPAGPH